MHHVTKITVFTYFALFTRTHSFCRFQNTPLHFAAKLGHLDCLKELLNFNFEINAQNEDDKCPLHLAAEYGRMKCAQELVKRDRLTVPMFY